MELGPAQHLVNAIQAGVTHTAQALRKIPGHEAMLENTLRARPEPAHDHP